MQTSPLINKMYKWVERINRAYYTRLYTQRGCSRGVDIFTQDWDNLLLLDACRYDALARYTDRLPGQLESRYSLGSMTSEFLKQNVVGRELNDVVYVTATAKLHQMGMEYQFYDEVRLWDNEENYWRADDGRFAIRPETVAEAAMEAQGVYPNKRLLIHFVQPHLPFLDPACSELKRKGNPYDAYIRGELSVTEADLKEAYRRNVEIVLPHVERLLSELEGKSVVSADHGELLGESAGPIPLGMWGHPHGTYTEELVKVPWLVTESPNRKRIVPERPVEQESANMEKVKDSLRSLGYV